jgi:hypothetical protein
MEYTDPIRIVQLNCARGNHVVTNLLNGQIDYADIILLQEPWWGRIGTDATGPVANPAWQPILPVSSVPEDRRPRVMAYVKQRNDFTVTLRSDITQDLDIQVLDIHQPPHPTTTIVNVYNGGRETRNAARHLRDLEVDHEGQPVIITGDFNMKHPWWADTDKAPAGTAAEFVEWIQNHGYELENKRGEPTFQERGRHARTSTIDLTFTNTAAAAIGSTKEWTVDRDISGDSDHFAIRWEVDYGAEEVRNQAGRWFNLKKADPEEWKGSLRISIGAEGLFWEAFRDRGQGRTNAELDEAVEKFTGYMERATEATAPERRPCRHAKPWWNKEMEEANQQVSTARKARLEAKQLDGAVAPELEDHYRKSRNLLKRLGKRAKRDYFDDILQEAMPGDIWAMKDWASGRRNYPSPAINRANGEPPAVEHEEKCDALRAALFKPPPPIDDNTIPDTTQVEADDTKHEPLSRIEVQEALFAQSADKAPGESQVPFRALRWAWQVAADNIHAIMHQCIENGYHPRAWRRAVAVALRKPKKPDYSKPKAYRLIQLLECLGKVLERIVAMRLSHMVGEHRLVPETQFVARANSSTVDAMLAYVHDVEAARNHNLVTSVLTFDISGFFDNVNHARMLCELRRRKIPLPLVRWVQSFLSEREAAVCLDGRRGKMKPVENGILQGSPVSPILSILYAAELLEIFDEAARPSCYPMPDKATATAFKMFVDDGHLMVSSTSLDTNVQLLRRAYTTVDVWLKGVGLASDPEKAELQHHSWRRDGGYSPTITLPGPDGQSFTLAAKSTICWLGVLFDRKLMFDQHARHLTCRARTSVNGAQMLANTVRGLSQGHLRTLYRACVLPVLTYAAPVWWRGRKRHLHALQKVQNEALRHMCGAFRTTPVRALEVDAAIMPLKHHIELTLSRYADRLHRLGQHSPITHRLRPEWRDGSAQCRHHHSHQRAHQRRPSAS